MWKAADLNKLVQGGQPYKSFSVRKDSLFFLAFGRRPVRNGPWNDEDLFHLLFRSYGVILIQKLSIVITVAAEK